MQKHVISLDWLELYTACLNKDMLGDFESNIMQKELIVTDRFLAKKAEFGTKFFATKYEVYMGKEQVATVTCCPRASFINKYVCLVKLENKVLYTSSWYDIMNDLLKEFNLKLKGITRLDVCYDCYRFKDGRKPHKFIKDFLSKDANEDGYIHRYGSNKFSIECNKKSMENARFSYIRFGSRTSEVQAYIYNKSKELREVKDKVYIRDTWKAAGMDEEKTDVWRAEISIRSQGLKCVDITTGELLSILPDTIMREYSIAKIFYAYARKYFNFGVRHGQKRPKDFDRIQLFDETEDVVLRPRAICRFMDTGRSEKMVVNKLHEVCDKYSDISSGVIRSIQETIDFFIKLSGDKEFVFKRKRYNDGIDTLRGKTFLPTSLNDYRDTPQHVGFNQQAFEKRQEDLKRRLPRLFDKNVWKHWDETEDDCIQSK